MHDGFDECHVDEALDPLAQRSQPVLRAAEMPPAAVLHDRINENAGDDNGENVDQLPVADIPEYFAG